MIKERYCSFEVAKLLKEKGFDVPCIGRYSVRSKEFHLDCTRLCNNGGLFAYAAPTNQMAMDWLREKGFHIEIYANASGYRFIISKPGGDGTDLITDIKGTNNGGAWNDYGRCVESAIDYCLTKLI